MIESIQELLRKEVLAQAMKQTKFTIEDYSKRHHGGYLGEKTRSLCEK